MKSLFTLLLSSLVAFSVFAADATGRVIVSLNGNRDYRVVVDGRSYGGTNRIYLNNLGSGRHTIEVYPAQSNRGRKNNPVQSTDFTVRPQYDLNIMVLPNGRLKFNETRSGYSNDRNNGYGSDRDERYGRDRDDRDDRYDRQGDNRNDRYDHRRDGRNNQYGRQSDDRDWRDRQDRNGQYGDRTNGGYNDYSRAMSDADFNTFVQRIRSQWFGKMNTARDGIRDNYFTTSQVRQVMQIFNAESDRLELAKLSYSRVVDPRSFTQVYDLLSSSGQAELDQYIRDTRY